jgi:hypothetical protein
LLELRPGHFVACHHPVTDSAVAVDITPTAAATA